MHLEKKAESQRKREGQVDLENTSFSYTPPAHYCYFYHSSLVQDLPKHLSTRRMRNSSWSWLIVTFAIMPTSVISEIPSRLARPPWKLLKKYQNNSMFFKIITTF